MKHWKLALILSSTLLLFSSFAGAAPPAGFFSDELNIERYDCQLTITVNKSASDNSSLRLLLEWQDELNYYCVTVRQGSVQLSAIANGITTSIADCPIKLTAGKRYQLTIGRRASHFLLIEDEILLRQVSAPQRFGASGGLIADAGWIASEVDLLRLESPIFTDDFMRTADDIGQWQIMSGKWSLQSAWDQIPHGNKKRFNNALYGQNPFALLGFGTENGNAICSTGNPLWDGYTVTAAVKPAENGAVGIQVNMRDDKNGIRVRWSAGNSHSSAGNRLGIYLLSNGVVTLIKEVVGGYIPGQWYSLSVHSAQGGINVAIDGLSSISIENVTPWRGGIALYAEGENPAIFDDITVYGDQLHREFLLESRRARMSKQFRDDQGGMKLWSLNRGDWNTCPASPSFKMYRWSVTGDQWLSLMLKPRKLASGELVLVLNSDGVTPESGYRAIIKLLPANKVSCSLYRGNEIIANEDDVPLPTDTEFPLHLWHIGDSIWLEIAEETVLVARDSNPLPGEKPAYSATGAFVFPTELMVTGPGVYDYSFAEAPVDWYAVGTWMPSIRWSCSPNWSFLAGWGPSDTILWHKKRFSGDQSLDVFMGLKMEYPRMTAVEDDRVRDFAVTICGDGVDPRNGYAAIMNSSNEIDDTRKIILLRDGVEVASDDNTIFTEDPHRHWWRLELRKTGNVIEFWLEGEKRPRLHFEDPDPISGGVPAIWTINNGITLARARIHAVKPAVCRNDQQVIIAQLASPEWSSVGVTESLDFSDSWSTNGKPVHLLVTRQNELASKTDCVKIDGLKLNFTPPASGNYSFQICAVDPDGVRSPPYDLEMKVFDSTVGRDDSHALVLYRFNEGSGNVVHDSSVAAPAAPVSIPTVAETSWLPRQGLKLHGSTPLLTTNGVKKLSAISRNNAFTIELWVSTDTVAPPTNTVGCMLSWESGQQKQNFTLGQCWYDISFGANGSGISPEYESGSLFSAHDAARAWLQHIVLSWDGKQMRCYVDGKLKSNSVLPSLNTSKFYDDAPLIIGNLSTGGASYLGTYYLVAIHDRKLNQQEITRHYQAGPGGIAKSNLPVSK